MEVTHQENPALAEATQTLQKWVEDHQQPGYDPVPTLTRLAEIIEAETENYMKMDPDPFDDRHPSRADPSCSLGQILKVLFRRDLFMTKLVNDYLRDNYWERLGMPERDSRQLNISVCRLVLDIMPGLEASAVFQDMEGLILRLFSWAEKSIEPLQSYATGLLASAMEVQDIAAKCREQNAKLVPLMLQRLHQLQAQMASNPHGQGNATTRPFAHLGADDLMLLNGEGTVKGGVEEGGGMKSPDAKRFSLTPKKGKAPLKTLHNGAVHSSLPSVEDDSAMDTGEMVNGVGGAEDALSPKPLQTGHKRKSMDTPPSRVGTSPFAIPESSPQSHQWTHPSGLSPAHAHAPHPIVPPSVGECSNSSWAEMESYVIGTVQIFPPTLSTRQILILRYLTPMGEYQEFLSHVFEHNALELILKYTNVRETKDARLAFEALKYLAALLCHKKFSIEFINMQGLQRLLEVPRPSVSATGVSMCLYYLAYCEDAIERVCLLPRHIVADLVRYSLWLLECSHDSGRCHATMFFGLSFQFRIILEEFDAQDGLRKLYNVVSTLPILSIEEDAALNEDEECAARQIVRHVCMALKRYFEAHLAIRVEQVKRATLRDQPMSPPGGGYDPNIGESPPGSPNFSLVPSNSLHSQSAWPPYKAMKWSSEEVQARVTTLLELMPMRAHWAPVEELLRLGGVTLLLQIIAFTYEWNYSGRAETVRSALDVLSVCCVMPRVQSVLCERVELPEESVTVGMNIVLGAAEGEIVADPDVQRAALNVIANCVCAPINRTSGVIGRYSVSGSSKKRTSALRSSEELINRVWESVRSNNGIMILLQLMTVKTPITDADSIRALACRALAGLARSETVRQIVSKLPMFTGGQIQTLLRDPILQDKRQEHVKFQRHALELLERVSGKVKPNGSDPHFDVSLNNIHRADVVAQTRITFNEQQLIQLIHKHLSAKGFTESAAALQREAALPQTPPAFRISNPAHHFPPFSYRSTGAMQSPVPALPSTPTTPLSSRSLRAANSHSSSGQSTSAACAVASSSSNASNTPTTSSTAINQPIKVNLSSSRKLERHSSTSGSLMRSLEKQTTASPLMAPTSASSPVPPSTHPVVTPYNPTSSSASYTTTPMASTSHQLTLPHHVPSSCLTASFQQHPPPGLTLDSIITEYLMNQHALCKNPMVTCPEFNLFVPHKCPDPNMRNAVPANVAVRLTRRPIYPPHGGYDGARLDRRLVHSRFFPVRSFRLVDDEGFFTCCQFLPDDQTIVMGTFQGEVKLFNIHSAVEESSFQCHDSYVYHMAANREGNLLLTSSTWRRPLSALWSVNKYIDMKFAIEEEEYVEFSKLTQDKIIGTKGQTATIYDVATAQKLMTLFPVISNQYTKNRATFSPSDELILSDGVLWDASTGKKVHKFDKLNQTLSGVFHPNGLEVVSNTEVWDLRTFHLLRTVPALDQCEVVFAPGGGVSVPPTAIYTVSLEQECEEDPSFESSFKTLDAYDYSSIATIDVKRNIYYLCVNRLDTQIAVVENLGMFDSVQESTVRLYDVGRRKDDEDEGEDEEEEDIDGGSEDGSDGSGSGSDDDDNDDDDDDSFEANNILGDWEQQNNNGEDGRRLRRRRRGREGRGRGAAGGAGEEGSAAEDAANQDEGGEEGGGEEGGDLEAGDGEDGAEGREGEEEGAEGGRGQGERGGRRRRRAGDQANNEDEVMDEDDDDEDDDSSSNGSDSSSTSMDSSSDLDGLEALAMEVIFDSMDEESAAPRRTNRRLRRRRR
ncbi:DDB1- and CUL4-associated factor 1 [Ischnura elegans]|uniref:DDB1- and CUL4-associated factor 1 n=1 Tax=Ischnura elegans TaxID=197161 RepID=UPI001ED881A4|nr:DDB1- and CUL4-associated factor 1 [Ischnura elegans]